MKEFKGHLFSFRIENIQGQDSEAMITMLSEDDEEWYPRLQFSASWLDELIEQVQKTKAHLDKNYKKSSTRTYLPKGRPESGVRDRG
jgi:hypothetical protein